jgi:hypothetical protein
MSARVDAYTADRAAAEDIAISSAASSAVFIGAAANAMCMAIHEDCARLGDVQALLTRPIWGGAANPLDEGWRTITSWIDAKATPEWAFWLDWYQRALDGTETRWALLRDIALLDKDADGQDIWASPLRVAAEIARLEAEHARKAGAVTDAALAHVIAETPNGERLVHDPEIGAIRAIPDTALPADYLQDTLDRLADAAGTFGDLSTPGNQYSALSPDIAKLNGALDRYAARPLRLHDVAADLSVRLDTRISNGECPGAEQDALIGSYRNALTGAMIDLQAHDPRVAEAVRKRLEHGRDTVDAEGQAALAAGVADAAPITEVNLLAEMRADLATLADHHATPAATRQALWALSSRLPRIFYIYRTELATWVTLGTGLPTAVAWIIRLMAGGS